MSMSFYYSLVKEVALFFIIIIIIILSAFYSLPMNQTNMKINRFFPSVICMKIPKIPHT